MIRRAGRLESCFAAAHETRRSGLRATLARFRRDEEGSLFIFGLFCFVMMLLVAGVALDLMRFEERRTVLQNTIDRATLAAADLQQTLPPKQVVIDYFVKAGLTPPDESDIVVNQGSFNEWRTVEAHVDEAMPTWFMRAMGVDTLSAPGVSAAEERIGQVEISLVLDVSGSMGDNNRMNNLRPAAKSFVDQMFDTVENGKLSISLVTYDTQVSAGPDLFSRLPVTYTGSSTHNKSYCLEFNTADFETTALRMGNSVTKYQQNGHFDWQNSGAASTWNCPTSTNRHIMAWSGSRSSLKSRIDEMQDNQWTSIDVGMKWGAALLDPSMQPVVDSLIAANKVPSGFSDRPYEYGDEEALKVIVVMSDGANTREYQLKADKRTGNSVFWRNPAYSSRTDRNAYSVWDASRNEWYIVARNIWRNKPWGAGRYRTCNSCAWQLDPGATGNPNTESSIQPSSTNPVYRLSWEETWETLSINWVASNLVGRAWGSSERDRWSASNGGTKVAEDMQDYKDDRLHAICSAAKTAGGSTRSGIKIFAIAFEAPSQGKAALRDCASSDSSYYETAGGDISSVFSSIANSINKLRLTQ